MNTVIFDCYGVLVSEGYFIGTVLAERMKDRIEPEALRARYRELATGRIDRAAFWAGLAEDWPAYEREFIGGLALDAQAVGLLESLHGRYRLALCSEGVTAWYQMLWRATGLEKYFDVLALSCELGLTKPSPAFFEAADRLMPAGPKAFIDDKLENLAAAARLGWYTIWLKRREDRTRYRPQATVHALSEVAAALPW